MQGVGPIESKIMREITFQEELFKWSLTRWQGDEKISEREVFQRQKLIRGKLKVGSKLSEFEELRDCWRWVIKGLGGVRVEPRELDMAHIT